MRRLAKFTPDSMSAKLGVVDIRDNVTAATRSSRARDDVLLDILRQHVQRHIAPEHHHVVERLDVVASAEGGHRTLALTDDFVVPDLVAARLAGPRTVAIHFA